MKEAATPDRSSPPRRKMASNAFYLITAQVTTLALPIVALPFLSRRLGPESWGNVAAIQSVGVIIGLVVDFGFSYSATRAVAVAEGDRADIGRTYGAVRALKTALCIVIGTVGLTVAVVVGHGPADFLLISGGVAFGLSQGTNLMWFFQGVEDPKFAAIADISGKAIAIAITLWLVQGPEESWVFMWALAGCGFIATGCNAARARRYFDTPATTKVAVRQTLRSGLGVMPFRIITSAYTIGATAWVHGMAGAVQAGYFASAEKVTTASRSVIAAATNAAYPAAAQRSPEAARKLRLTALGLMVPPYLAACLAGQLLASWFIPWFFGSAFTEAVGAFRILLLILPCSAATSVLGVLGPVARGDVRSFNAKVSASAALCLTLAVWLVPSQGASGMAVALVAAEASLLLMLLPELKVRPSREHDEELALSQS